MNPAKLWSIIRGDPLEHWLDRQQRKLEARGLGWTTKVGLLVVAALLVAAAVAYDVSLKP